MATYTPHVTEVVHLSCLTESEYNSSNNNNTYQNEDEAYRAAMHELNAAIEASKYVYKPFEAQLVCKGRAADEPRPPKPTGKPAWSLSSRPTYDDIRNFTKELNDDRPIIIKPKATNSASSASSSASSPSGSSSSTGSNLNRSFSSSTNSETICSPNNVSSSTTDRSDTTFSDSQQQQQWSSTPLLQQHQLQSPDSPMDGDDFELVESPMSMDNGSESTIGSKDLFSLRSPTPTPQPTAAAAPAPQGAAVNDNNETNKPYDFHTRLGKRLYLEPGYWTVALYDMTYKLKMTGVNVGRFFVETDIVRKQSNIGNLRTRNILASVPVMEKTTNVQNYLPPTPLHVELADTLQPIQDIRIHIKRLDGSDFTDIERPVNITLLFTKYHT